MSKHLSINTGIGIGLMAASLGASADFHSFAQPMIYYKINGSSVNYNAIIPSMYGNAAGVIMLDLFQSGTVSSWNYAVGGAIGAASNGGASWGILAKVAATSDWASLSVTYYDVLGTRFSSQMSDTSSYTSSWYGGDNAVQSLSFVQTVIGAGAAATGTASTAGAATFMCPVSFTAEISTDDYLRFSSYSVTIPSQASLSANICVPTVTVTGTNLSAAAQFTSYASTDWNSIDTGKSSYISLPTYSAYFSIARYDTNSSSPVVTVVGTANQAIRSACAAAVTSRNALNTAGNTIGSKTGMMRLW